MAVFEIIYKRKKTITLTITLLVIGFLYFLSSNYINCSNDGSHFALVSAMVNNKSTELGEYVNYTAKIDYAVKDGKFYSDRLPGNAFLMLPFFLFGGLLTKLNVKPAITWRPIEEVSVILESNVLGITGVFFLFLIFRHFRFSFKLSLFSAIIYAVCTLNWQESTHVFSHAASMCFVLMSIYFLLKSKSINQSSFLWAVIFLSYSLIIELQNLLFFLPILVYTIKTNKIDLEKGRQNSKTIFSIFTIFSISFTILLLYNYLTFGELILKSNKYNPNFPEEMSFLSSLSGNFIKGLDTLFVNFRNIKLLFNWDIAVRNETPGLFIISPILLFSIPGFVLFYKQQRNEAILFLLLIFINVLIAAFHKTVLTRHVFTITPLLFFPSIYSIKWVLKHKNILVKTSGIVLLIVLVLLSAVRIFYVTHTYYGRELTNVFPFKNEISVYLIFLSFLVILTCLFFVFKYLLLFFKTKINSY